MFRFHHQIVTNASDEVFHWPGEAPISMRRVPGSALRIPKDEPSPGLQVIDVILWLFKRALANQDLGPEGGRLLQQVFRRGRQNDLSLIHI